MVDDYIKQEEPYMKSRFFNSLVNLITSGRNNKFEFFHGENSLIKYHCNRYMIEHAKQFINPLLVKIFNTKNGVKVCDVFGIDILCKSMQELLVSDKKCQQLYNELINKAASDLSDYQSTNFVFSGNSSNSSSSSSNDSDSEQGGPPPAKRRRLIN